MQKKLIALAVAGLVSAPVFAQSNVTIYGIVDAGVGVGEFGGNDFRGVLGGVLSGNRIGFRGTEDLGNGLKAVFQLENGFDIGTGVGSPQVGGTNTVNVGDTTVINRTVNDRDSVFSRQAWVGLQGAFGTVGLGRQYAPGYAQQYDVTNSAAIGPQSLLSAGAGLTITPNSGARWDNSVSYDSSFAGLKARAIYSAKGVENSITNADGDSPSQDDAWGLGLEYANGPLKVGGVFHQVKEDNLATPNDKAREWLVGASFNFNVLTVAASYQRGDDLRTTDDTAKLWQVGVGVPIGAAGQVQVAYGKLDNEVGALDDAGAKSWTVGYTHALSKRTTAYAMYNRTDNEDDTAAFRPLSGEFLSDGTAGEHSKLFTVGMRHAF